MARPRVGRGLLLRRFRNFCRQKKKPPGGGFFPRAESLLGGAGGSRRGGRGSRSRGGGGGGRASSSGGGASGGVDSRGGGGSRSRNDDGSRGRSGSRLFLLATSGEGGGGNQRGQNERFIHFRFPSGDGRQVSGKCPGGFCTASDRVEKARALSSSASNYSHLRAFAWGLPAAQELYRPRVVAGNAGVALRSHSSRDSRSATRRSGSLPQ